MVDPLRGSSIDDQQLGLGIEPQPLIQPPLGMSLQQPRHQRLRRHLSMQMLLTCKPHIDLHQQTLSTLSYRLQIVQDIVQNLGRYIHPSTLTNLQRVIYRDGV